ncbi:pyridoxamine phosphate oxidase [Magnaporthiopsis poae ATCC 64411]|uniref:Pyridoxamine phosphate oxidase n=1 Tax=Magnaporthiopsis poae (strain ATCC 64411 / 73-15) TaxID=644358 RepID=A0A0C4E768_MAGP6|nr:pyridoxamine phosphate oxidase [Magnaporthiopsis poae ATCC 64411]
MAVTTHHLVVIYESLNSAQPLSEYPPRRPERKRYTKGPLVGYMGSNKQPPFFKRAFPCLFLVLFLFLIFFFFYFCRFFSGLRAIVAAIHYHTRQTKNTMKEFPSLTPDLMAWALRQPVYFLATAPTHGRHINLSPKGLPSSTLSVLTPNRVAYVDRTGSGCETLAHLYENGRATVMFMSMGSAPRILRLYCRAREVVEWTNEARLAALLVEMGGLPKPKAPRAIVVLDVWKVTTSCGYGVPMVRRALYAGDEGMGEGKGKGDETDVFEERKTLDEAWAKKERAGEWVDYQRRKNAWSLDGLPALKAARSGETGGGALGMWFVMFRARMAAQREGVAVGLGIGLVLALVLVLVLTGRDPARVGGARG